MTSRMGGRGYPTDRAARSVRCAVMRLLASLLAVALLGVACGAESGPPSCAALETWQRSHQQYLDHLADRPQSELDEPEPDTAQAGAQLGAALLEAGREALVDGCEAELEVGAAGRCARTERLQAHGPAAEQVLADLKMDCD